MKKFLLLSALLCFSISIKAQKYLEMIDAGTYPVEDVIAQAEAYFKDKDKGRGTGYKQFKRWEYMAKRLMKENGYLPTVSERWQQIKDYNAYLNETAGERNVLNADWQELGPSYYQATTSWSPGVGRVTGIDIDKNNANHIIIGANTGGVWRTVDGGENWTPLNDNYTNMYVYSVAIDPQDSDTYYFGSESGTVFKSEDAGATWSLLGDFSNSLVNRILINPDNSDIMFAASENSGIYRTSDGGATWNQVISGNGYDVEFKPGDTQTVYAGSQSVYKSTDGGSTFTQISGFNDGAKMLAVSPDDPEIVYVVDADGGQFGGLYVSNDSGASYTELNHTGRNYFGYDTNGFDPGGQAPRDMDVAVNPNDASEVHIAGVLTWKSNDGGENFSITSDWIPNQAAGAGIGYCHADVDLLVFDGSTMFVGTDGGIFKAEDTNNVTADYYENITEGIGIRQFYKIGISQTEDVVVTGGSQDNGSSFYTEANGWKDWLGADGMEGFIDKVNTQVMYGTSQNGGLYRTDNGASTYVGLNTPPGTGNWVTPFEQDPVLANTVYVGYNRVYKSVNKGATWNAISQNFNVNLDEMKIAPSNPDVIYASSSFRFYKTIDGGSSSWVEMPIPGGSINNFAVHPNDPNKIALAVTGINRVKVSNDGGETWQTLTTNLPEFSALSIVWANNGLNGLYLGMDYGIYYIDDTMTGWEPFNTNLPNVIVNELEINEADGKIYAGTYGRGLWASPMKEVVLSNEDFIASNTVSLHPNPANSSVNITLPEAIDASIRVFDVTGKLVVYKPNTSINREYTLDISTLKSGVYFVRISSSKGTFTKKLIKN